MGNHEVLRTECETKVLRTQDRVGVFRKGLFEHQRVAVYLLNRPVGARLFVEVDRIVHGESLGGIHGKRGLPLGNGLREERVPVTELHLHDFAAGHVGHDPAQPT